MLTALVFAALAALSLSAQPEQSAAAKIDAAMAKWTTSTPGCAIGASLDGKTVVSNAWGRADLEHDVPNTADTIFEAGSVSKQFTAAAVALLARDGKLSLDDPARKYIPELPDYGAPLTIRHMLQHMSGLRDWGALEAIAGWPRTTRVYTHDHVLDIVSRQKALNFTPGQTYSYSNTGYNLAAIIVSRVSGMPFAEFTKRRIFDPLGMTKTSWRDDFRRIVKGRAVAYAFDRGVWAQEMPFENIHGNGGLLTTVGDLLKWNDNFITHVVGDAAFQKLQETPGLFNDGKPGTYGLGLVNSPYRGQPEIGHSGSTAGYRAHLLRNPGLRLSVAVLCNASTGDATNTAHLVQSALAPSVFGGVPPGTPGSILATLRPPAAVTWSDLTGTFMSDEIETTLVGVVRGDGIYVLTRRPADEIVLAPTARKDVFNAGPLGTVTFRRDAAGRVTSLSVKQDRVWDLVFTKR